MSDDHDDTPPSSGGRRKDGKPFKEGNTREDGSYAIGKNRAPPGGQFRAGDGRKRGRRTKGVRNADTEFARELAKMTTIKENGVARKVSKSLAVDLRLLSNAAQVGDNRAIELVDQRRQRIAQNAETASRYHTLGDLEILAAYLRGRATELNIPADLFGDPAPENQGEGGND